MTAKEYNPWMRVHTTNHCECMTRVRKTDTNLDWETCPGYLQHLKSNEKTQESEQQDSSRNQESDPQLLKFNEMVGKQTKQPPGEMTPEHEHWVKCQRQYPDRTVHGFLLYPPGHPYSRKKVREAKLRNGTQQKRTTENEHTSQEKTPEDGTLGQNGGKADDATKTTHSETSATSQIQNGPMDTSDFKQNAQKRCNPDETQHIQEKTQQHLRKIHQRRKNKPQRHKK